MQQSPWIQNMTIRDNILFGSPYSKDRYQETLRICELERDLSLMPGGDLTEIGESGLNLSGGQKARLSIARAVYSDKDILLFDDPLSALDANVRKRIFQAVFLEKLKGKTVILTTHAVDLLPSADRILILEKGSIVQEGTYEALKDSQYLNQVLSLNQ